MAAISVERVIGVHHWSDRLFSFATTRDAGLRFENGHFVMVGLEVDGRRLLRAYSIASANYEEQLEFYSIKVQSGALTSRLQRIREGDPILVSSKPTGTLVLRDLKPGKRLYLLATGTGVAPFVSVIRDPETYERFEKIVLVRAARHASELAYGDHVVKEVGQNEFLRELVRAQLVDYPTVTREVFRNQGRIPVLIESGRLFADLGLPVLDPQSDRVMVCGSPGMLADTRKLLDARGFRISPHVGEPGDYVIERAFVDAG
ncbi:MAG TPA: ferredoxin--NADP reductase [Steroidobacteraceae bacterium]